MESFERGEREIVAPFIAHFDGSRHGQPRRRSVHFRSVLRTVLVEGHELTIRTAYLIADDEELQAQALLLKCLSRIYTLLTISKPSSSPYSSPAQERATTTFHSALLLSLASLSSSNESHRKQLLDEPSIAFLPLIISNLEHYSPRVRIAAGYCLKGLSRSVGVLRTKLVEVGAVGILLRLLRDEEEEKGVRTVVLAVIGNLLIDFSPLKAVSSSLLVRTT